MNAYFFKFDDGKSDSYYQGIAVANSISDLFWQIDEFGDPSAAKFIPASAYTSGFCVKITESKDYDGEGNYGFVTSDHEIGGCAPSREDDRWESMDWPDIKELLRNKKEI